MGVEGGESKWLISRKTAEASLTRSQRLPALWPPCLTPFLAGYGVNAVWGSHPEEGLKSHNAKIQGFGDAAFSDPKPPVTKGTESCGVEARCLARGVVKGAEGDVHWERREGPVAWAEGLAASLPRRVSALGPAQPPRPGVRAQSPLFCILWSGFIRASLAPTERNPLLL